MAFNWRFLYPFTTNHCMVVAMAHLTGRRGARASVTALRIAAEAYERPRFPGSYHSTRSGGDPLLTKNGTALSARLDENLQQWSEIAGIELDVAAKVRYSFGDPTRPTLQRFAREHRRGSWLVFTRGHALALVDGEVLGFYRPRSKVELAVPVKSKPNIIKQALYAGNARWQEQLRLARLAAARKRTPTDKETP